MPPDKTPKKRVAIPKPDKPWAGFPLYWHSRGYWMCRRNGEDWIYEADAVKSYNRYVLDVDAARRGTERPEPVKRYALKDAVNLYLTRQKRRHDGGELSDAQFTKCRHEFEIELPKAVKLSTPLSAFRNTSPGDHGPAALLRSIRAKAIARGLQAAHRHIVLVRAMLDYAAGKKLMLAPDYGDDFDPPAQSAIDRQRRERDEQTGERAWTIGELRKIVTEAKRRGEDRWAKKASGKRANKKIHKNPHLYAQVLLGLFGALGSDDLSVLKESALDRKRGVIRGFRAKNGRPFVFAPPKRVWDAIDKSFAARADPADDEAKPLVFRTTGGHRCNVASRTHDERGLLRVGRNDTIGKTFQRFLKSIGLHKHRAGFKTLRAMCRTMMVGAGIDEDVRAVMMGRRLRYPVDEYYVRGDLREKLVAAGVHIERELFSSSG